MAQMRFRARGQAGSVDNDGFARATHLLKARSVVLHLAASVTTEDDSRGRGRYGHNIANMIAVAMTAARICISPLISH